MKRFFIILSLAGLNSCTSQAVNAEEKFANISPNSTACCQTEGQVLILFLESNADLTPLQKALKPLHAETIYHYQALNGMAIRLPHTADLTQTIAHLEQIQGVLSVMKEGVNVLH